MSSQKVGIRHFDYVSEAPTPELQLELFTGQWSSVIPGVKGGAELSYLMMPAFIGSSTG